MQSNNNNFLFGPNFNFSTTSVFTAQNRDQGVPFPPVSGDFDLLDGTDYLLLDGTSYLLL